MKTAFKIIGFICILGGLYFYVHIAQYLDLGQTFHPINADTCKRLDTPEGPEDIIWIGDYALSVVDDRLDLFEFNNVNTTYMGDIILITPYPLSFRNLPIVDYPEEDNFHPHGMYLHDNKTLFVINHGFNKGGERIDIMQVHFKPSIHIKYKRSITFPDKFMGVLQDLVAVSREEFFITQNRPCPDDKHHGRDHSLSSWIHNTFYHAFMDETHLHYCKDNFGVADCHEEVISGGKLSGIGTDGEELFVNDAARKEVKRYSVGLKHERHIELIETIPLPRACHNIEYDPGSGNFYLGSIGNQAKTQEYLHLAREKGQR